MAQGRSAGTRHSGSQRSIDIEEAREYQIELDGPEGGWMTLVDFAKVSGITRQTLATYRDEGMDGFRVDEEEGGLYPDLVFKAILARRVEQSKPATDAAVQKAKDDIVISQADKAKRTMQMVAGRTIHLDDLAFMIREIVGDLDSTIQAWPKTLTVEIASFLSNDLIKRAASDPVKAAERKHAVQMTLALLDQPTLSSHIGALLNTRRAAAGDSFRALIPDLVKRAVERGQKAAGIR